MKFYLKHILALSAACLAAGCATDRSFGLAPNVDVANLDELPPPRGEIFYTIGPQEAIDIVVIGAEELSGTYLTDEEGRLDFPLLGTLETGGRSPGAASQLIVDGLRGRFLNDPQVRIIPQQFQVPSISVGGQVMKPGSYPAVGTQTLLRIVNNAGGLSEYAQYDDVIVMRSVDGQRYIGVYNIKGIQRGNYPDPELYPNDIVMVGDSPARRRLDKILSIIPLVTNSIILVDRLSN